LISKRSELRLTRLETWAQPGVPDLLVCDHHGRFHFIELKVSKGRKVNLSPHQIAWLTNHNHASAWIIVRHRHKGDERLSLYHAKQAMSLKERGLDTAARRYVENKKDWHTLFDLIAPM
jgi:Holliday junction resolvase